MNIVFVIILVVIILGTVLGYHYYNRKQVVVSYDNFTNSINIKKDKKEYIIEPVDIMYYNNDTNEIGNGILSYDDFTFDEIIIEPELIERPEQVPPTPLINRIDSQNVHDSLVQSGVKDIHKNIKKNVIQENLKDYKVYNDITTQFPEMSSILEKIYKRNSKISNIDKREVDVIKDVWMASLDDPNIKEYFILQLKDCVSDSGHLHCPTGVVTRLTSSLMINDPENMPKDTGSYKDEVLSKFSLLKNKFEDNNKIKDLIVQEYPETTRQKISEFIDSWINHV